MYCKLATSREKWCLNSIRWICYSADLYGCCLKKNQQELPFYSHYSDCSVRHKWHNVSLPLCAPSPCGWYIWGTARPITKGSWCCTTTCSALCSCCWYKGLTGDAPLPHLAPHPCFSLRALLPIAPLSRSQSHSGFPFLSHFDCCSTFLPSSLLLRLCRPFVHGLVYLCELNGRWFWCIQPGTHRKSPAAAWWHCPRSGSITSPPTYTLRTEIPAFIRCCEHVWL